MPKTDVSVLKQDNDYQIINYKTNNLYDVSDETIQDLINTETMEMYIDIVNGKKIAELAEIIKQHQSRNKQL